MTIDVTARIKEVRDIVSQAADAGVSIHMLHIRNTLTLALEASDATWRGAINRLADGYLNNPHDARADAIARGEIAHG